MRMDRVRSLARKVRFMLIVSGEDRASFLRKRQLFRAMGNDVFFQPRKLPNDPNLILFHNNITVASDVTFVSHDVMHRVFNAKHGAKVTRINEGCIEIMDNVFIGSNSLILPDVRIGPNAIVGAGSVVTRDVPEGSVVAGVPAKVIGRFDDLEDRRRRKMDAFEGVSRSEIDDLLWRDFWARRESA